MDDILYIKEAMTLLKYRHYTSFSRWCRRNEVKIFREHGGKRNYVIYVIFHQARLKYAIEYLKSKYHFNWQSFLPGSNPHQKSNGTDINENKGITMNITLEKENYYQSRLNKFISEL
jgi:hypothetical protein